MVGRGPNADYRRDFKFVSRTRYNRYSDCYSRIQVQPIVASVTGPYHASTSRNQLPFTKEAPKV
jgi:hypothetical protein